MALDEYTYIFAIGTFFALLDAYNNGANDVANAWATSVSSRSITYRQAMIFGTIFEMLGAITVGARTAETIKNGIIPNSAFQGNPGVQMLAFTCALAAASSWVMWCTRHSAHVSSTYSLVSAVAGVGVATVGASQVQWGWNDGKGLGAIFAGLGMAPLISAGFGATIFMLIKGIVHMRKNPIPWAVYTAPFFFLVAGTICTLSIVYKGSPNLGLKSKPAWYIAAVTMGTGGGVCLLSALFFVPYVYSKVIKKDHTVKWYMFVLGPLLFKRPAPADADRADVPNYAVVQEDEFEEQSSTTSPEPNSHDINEKESKLVAAEATEATRANQATYKELMAEGESKLHARLLKKRGPLGWAMRTLRDNPMGPGQLYELHNMKIVAKRIPAMLVCGALYGLHYDIHAAQTGIAGTPEGERMAIVYASAVKYPNEVEHTYSFIQVLTACTASFAHGANDIGNSVGPWAVIYAAWSTGDAAAAKATVPVWQLAVLSLTISIGLITYGYNIMKVMGNKITYHSPSRGCSMEMGAAITVLVFSQYSLPVSTSMCITGATVGVGLCNGTLRAVNFQRVGLLLLSWIATIPIAGTLGVSEVAGLVPHNRSLLHYCHHGQHRSIKAKSLNLYGQYPGTEAYDILLNHAKGASRRSKRVNPWALMALSSSPIRRSVSLFTMPAWRKATWSCCLGTRCFTSWYLSPARANRLIHQRQSRPSTGQSDLTSHSHLPQTPSVLAMTGKRWSSTTTEAKEEVLPSSVSEKKLETAPWSGLETKHPKQGLEAGGESDLSKTELLLPHEREAKIKMESFLERQRILSEPPPLKDEGHSKYVKKTLKRRLNRILDFIQRGTEHRVIDKWTPFFEANPREELVKEILDMISVPLGNLLAAPWPPSIFDLESLGWEDTTEQGVYAWILRCETFTYFDPKSPDDFLLVDTAFGDAGLQARKRTFEAAKDLPRGTQENLFDVALCTQGTFVTLLKVPLRDDLDERRMIKMASHVLSIWLGAFHRMPSPRSRPWKIHQYPYRAAREYRPLYR
ncbi:hypothetical protein G7046_g2021 [Stylonectria norvegica]|nr:hypothetical protein G7046_g2021 [Stylonectria norvegica]